jgi:glycosyltransferase involved in cell wall biosynthesis
MSKIPIQLAADAASSPRVRVLFVLPSLLRAGAETQTVNLVNGLDSLQFEQHLLTFESQCDQLARVDRRAVTYHNFLRESKLDFGLARKIGHLIDACEIDVVHCSLQIALLFGWWGVRCSARKPPLVLAVHTTVNANWRYELFDILLFQFLMRSCRKVIFVCDTQRKYWEGKFPFLRGVSEVVHNGVDTAYFDPAQNITDGSRRDDVQPVFCHVAAFREEKGHSILLDAIQIVLASYPNARFVLVGDGPMRGHIEGKARAMGLTKAIIFTGSVADVRPLLAGATASIIASTAVETFSIAMLESLALGVPMVATDIGGTREAVVDGQTGFLVQPGSAISLAKGLMRILEAPNRAHEMGERGRQVVIEQFSITKMLERTSSILLQVAGHAPSNVTGLAADSCHGAGRSKICGQITREL